MDAPPRARPARSRASRARLAGQHHRAADDERRGRDQREADQPVLGGVGDARSSVACRTAAASTRTTTSGPGSRCKRLSWCRRGRVDCAHAARRRRRHLHRGRRHPLAQGQDRGVRRAARAGRRLERRRDRDRDVLPRPGRCGSGAPAWAGASCSRCPTPADSPSLTVLEVHEAFDAIAALAGAGSQARPGRGDGRAVRPGDRRGAGVAARRRDRRGAAGRARLAGAGGAWRPRRRAAGRRTPRRDDGRLDGGRVVRAALDRRRGGAGRVRLEVGRPVLPMLASQRAHDRGGDGQGRSADGEVAIDTKLDGIRIQVHRCGDEVLIATRTLEDITARLPEVVEVARALPADRRSCSTARCWRSTTTGRPRPFQETASRTAMAAGVARDAVLLRPAAPRRRRPARLARRRAARGPGRAGARGAPGRRGWSPPTSTRREAFVAARARRRPRGRGREEPRRAVRRRPPRLRRG